MFIYNCFFIKSGVMQTEMQRTFVEYESHQKPR